MLFIFATMIVIGDILISDDIVESYFHCNLDACKGACCWEGDWGAPLEKTELSVLDDILDVVKPLLSEKSRDLLEEKGAYTYYPEIKQEGTTLHNNGACVFLTFGEDGIAKCGIEQAWMQGLVDFRKPVSCHLYPIRIKRNPELGFEAMNYDRWHICNPACNLGEKKKIPLYIFVKDAIIRAYGQDFWDELDAAANHLKASLQDEEKETE